MSENNLHEVVNTIYLAFLDEHEGVENFSYQVQHRVDKSLGSFEQSHIFRKVNGGTLLVPSAFLSAPDFWIRNYLVVASGEDLARNLEEQILNDFIPFFESPEVSALFEEPARSYRLSHMYKNPVFKEITELNVIFTTDSYSELVVSKDYFSNPERHKADYMARFTQKR